MFTSEERSSVWGNSDLSLPPQFAAFVNGVAVSWSNKNRKNWTVLSDVMMLVTLWFCHITCSQVHSMDFDDTWHPATHPSGAVLPAVLALAETLPSRPSGLDLLLAFNIGIEVQGRLMRFSTEAYNIPERWVTQLWTCGSVMEWWTTDQPWTGKLRLNARRWMTKGGWSWIY